jgi:polyphosphate kinase
VSEPAVEALPDRVTAAEPTKAGEPPEAGELADRRHPGAVDLADPALYINRELSWLEFNDRVLQLAEDESLPLIERV